MSRWWRRKQKSGTEQAAPADDEISTSTFSDVRIVKREDAVLAELSEAFSEPDQTPEQARRPAAELSSVGRGDGRIDPLVDPVETPQERSARALDAALDELGVEVDPGIDRVPGTGESDDDVTEPTVRDVPGRTTISIGGDDEIPDTAYLDDELARDPDADSDSAPVFIEDDGTGDAIAAKDATGPGIEPRMRQRRIGVRRAEGRRRLFWAAIGAGVLLVIVSVLAVLGSSLFAVDGVTVNGVQRTNAEAVDAVVEDLLGEPVLLVDTDRAESELEAMPYVEQARVRTDFPDRATIEIREREPVATARGEDGRFRIIDREGRVLDVIEGQPIEFVLIAGEGTVDLEPGQFTDSGYAAAAAMVTKLTPEIRARLVSMTAAPDGSDLRFTLSNEPGPPIEVRLGAAISDSDQIERLVRLQRRLDDVIGSDTTEIDVSTAETTER